jgi:hypothetical protein
MLVGSARVVSRICAELHRNRILILHDERVDDLSLERASDRCDGLDLSA